ncbi:MAG: hypothetical protein Q8P23_00790 [bacterium]|nr:hypothetical protein [bacterium]
MKGFVIAGILAGLAGLVFLAVKQAQAQPEEPEPKIDFSGDFGLS